MGARFFLIAFVFLLALGARVQAGSDTPVQIQPAQAQDMPAAAHPRFAFHATISPDQGLLTGVQALLAPYFDRAVDLKGLAQKLIIESSVVELPGIGQILYNPAHMLFLHIPQDWERGGSIRVATLEDVRNILKKYRTTSLFLAAYTQAYDELALFSDLMKDENTRQTLEVVWTSGPRSDDDRNRMRYLLLRPIEQAAEARRQSPDCRQAIDRYVDEVRAGKRDKIPLVPGLTSMVRPTRFIRDGKQIVLVLSDPLIARYHIVARFRVTSDNCTVAWESHFFGM